MINGGIFQAAMELVKEKEKQGDKALDRVHDSMMRQSELRATSGSWTDGQKPKVEKVKVEKPLSTSSSEATESTDDKKDKDDIMDMGLMDLAGGAK